MHNTQRDKTLQSLDEALTVARIAARGFTKGASPEDREDAEQEAAVAVLEAYRAGKRGTFSYFYTIAKGRLCKAARSAQRRTAREYAYSERQYGIDAVTQPAV